MNETTLLAYGQRELAAFRADMRARNQGSQITDKPTSKGITAVLRNADARRNAAGLTRSQAERACVLAARAEGKAK